MHGTSKAAPCCLRRLQQTLPAVKLMQMHRRSRLRRRTELEGESRVACNLPKEAGPGSGRCLLSQLLFDEDAWVVEDWKHYGRFLVGVSQVGCGSVSRRILVYVGYQDTLPPSILKRRLRYSLMVLLAHRFARLTKFIWPIRIWCSERAHETFQFRAEARCVRLWESHRLGSAEAGVWVVDLTPAECLRCQQNVFCSAWKAIVVFDIGDF